MLYDNGVLRRVYLCLEVFLWENNIFCILIHSKEAYIPKFMEDGYGFNRI